MENENKSDNQDTSVHQHQHGNATVHQNTAERPHVPEHQHSAEYQHHATASGPDWKFYVIIAAIYLVIALVAFAYVTFNMTSVTTGIGGDAYLNLWDIWWVGYATLALHGSIWSSNLVYWPVGENLVYHTLAPLAGLMALPFSAMNLPFAYNTIFFLSFAFSGLAMYILADYFLKNKYASFIAGLLFSFSATHIDHALGLLIFTQVEWIPLSLYFFIRMVKEKKILYAAALGVSLMLATFMGNIEQTIMIGLLLFVVLVLYIIYGETRKLVLSVTFVKNVAVALAVCFIVGSWGFVPLLLTILQPGALSTASINNTMQYNMLWSADLLTFFVPSYYNSIFYPALRNSSLYLPDPAERIAYIGYVVLALSALAVYKNFKSVRLWIVIAVVFALTSLGPSILINGYSTGIPTPYNLYHAIPAIGVIREPGRFSIITALGFAMLAGFGAKYLFEKEGKTFGMEKKRFALFGTAVISFLYLLEVNGLILIGPVAAATTTPIASPPLYSEIAGVSGNFSTLSLPALPSSGIAPDLYPGMATYYQALSHKPIVGGLDGRTNTTQLLSLYDIPLVLIAQELEMNTTPAYLSPVSQNYTNQTIMQLYNYKTAYVIIYKDAFSQQALSALVGYMVSAFGSPAYNDNTTIAFSTSNAISRTVYKSYVSFPYLTDWQSVQSQFNGSTIDWWVPYGGGAITVYPPSANSTSFGQASEINTTVTFTAESLSELPATLLVGVANSTSVQQSASVNVTTTPSKYVLHFSMLSAPYPSTVLFEAKQAAFGSQEIGISNITFSRG